MTDDTLAQINTEREPTVAEWVAELVKVVRRMEELMGVEEKAS
jgi:hypothetical protein